MIVRALTLLSLVFGNLGEPYPDVEILDAVVNGPIKKIAELDRDNLLYNLQFLQNVETKRERKTAVFMRVKGEGRFDEMNMTDIIQMGIFLQGIPSYNLRTELDCNKVDIVSFLGRVRMRRKLLGVVAQCLKKEFGKEVYLSYRFINKFFGIICGFGVEELARIDENNFILIDAEVFINLDECNSHQLEALYEIAVRPTVYGIPQGWNKSVVRTIGTLLSITPLKDLLGMDHMAFSEIKPKVLRSLSLEKLNVLKMHLRYFELEAKNEIWRMGGIPSRSMRTKDETGSVALLVVSLVYFQVLYL